MAKNLSQLLLLLTIWLALDGFVLAQEKAIVINEVAWMGTKNSYNDEWIELYNSTKSPVRLNGWILKSKRGKPEIELSGTIKAQSYFLLERTDDDAVPEISADQIYTGGLNNNGEHLLLLNNLGEIVDKIDCTLGWFAGSNETKKTMERINPFANGSDPSNWKSSQKTGGTPRTKNSSKKENRNEKKIKMISTAAAYSGSDFSFVLAVGLIISLFFAMLILAFWLKIKKKKDKIKQKL